MKLKCIALSLLALSLGSAGLLAAKAHASPYGTNPTAIQDRDDHDWDAPPQEFKDVQRKGFHDGIEAARDDVDHHRAPDADHHDNFRHPHVAREDRDAYREGFRRGYDKAIEHLNGGHEH